MRVTRMRHSLLLAAVLFTAADAAAVESWVLFGAALGYRSGCDPSYIWKAEPMFHNGAAAARTVAILHQSGIGSLPSTVTIPAGTSLPLSRFVGGPPLSLGAIELDVPADVTLQPRLEYEDILPCSGFGAAPGPTGHISLPLFHVVDAGAVQPHYGLDLGIQPVRINAGVYNAGTGTATANITVRRPACETSTTTVVAVPPDTLAQVPVAVPPICEPVNGTPMYMVNATVVVDQPSFSYATTVSNGQAPSATFGVGTQ